ncbi:MAG TPA: alpha/beta hydrolase-fold protein, partial [Gemmatimonadales bacterium]|nr:alpha/beta hydrolase-fold protein [Gemmatimonadales bacterium]
ANHAAYAAFVGNELVPWTRRHYRVSPLPGRAVITGSSAGGLAAAYIALERPDLFGNVLSQSGAFWRGNEGSNDPPWEYIAVRAAALPHRQIRFLLDVGALETRGAMQGRAPSILAANRRLRDTLEARGYRVTYTEVPGGEHSPASWRLRLPMDLVTLMGEAP